MKTLYLLRHAKSSWDDPDLDDRDRPLAPRGERACERLGRQLASLGVKPDLVLCSSARRAVETLMRVRLHLAPALRVLTEPGLYAATPDALLTRIRRLDPGSDRVLLVGHEPGLSQLACRLTAPDDTKERRRMERRFPTAALAELRFAADRWRDVGDGSGELVRFVRPRDLA